ncbi:MAG: hypothetical protein ACRCY4_09565 [Brevinema sp.]
MLTTSTFKLLFIGTFLITILLCGIGICTCNTLPDAAENQDVIKLNQRLSVMEDMVCGKTEPTDHMRRWFENFMLVDFPKLTQKRRKAIRRKYRILFSKDQFITETKHDPQEEQQ